MSEVTVLLKRWSGGDKASLDRLFPLVYEELRALAGKQLSGERPNHTLQVTGLVNEAYLRLAGQDHASWENRRQFLLVASTMMRRVLVDYARRRAAARRPPEEGRVLVDEIDLPTDTDSDLVDLDAALTKLAEVDPRQGQIVELRFFTGLDIAETARVLDLSVSTITREWRMARAWLKRELEDLED